VELLPGTYVVVREMEEEDSEAVVAWRHRPDTWRWFYHWEPLTPESQRRWFRSARSTDVLMMFDTLDGEPVGTGSIYGFHNPRTGRTGQFGRFVAARHPAQPVPLLEAVYLSHRLAFEVLGLRRMIAEMTLGNDRAHRMLRFMGYADEGLLRRHGVHPDGHVDDLVPMGLFPEEFAAQRPAIEKVLYRGGPAPEIAAEQAARLRERWLGDADRGDATRV
jgi:RimJ/RimL family protein N-acetyltransferase